MKKGFAPVTILVVIVLIVLASGAAYYFGVKKGVGTQTVACTEDALLCPDGKTYVGRVAPNCDFGPCPSPTATEQPLKPGWQTYKNQQYGFQISYPPNYKALTDKENLYGWPKAIVLIYGGGQSYDLPIEAWNSKDEYEAKYKNATNLVVKEVNGKFITLMNVNYEPEVDEIISTFTLL